jgi:hypothetical protein
MFKKQKFLFFKIILIILYENFYEKSRNTELTSYGVGFFNEKFNQIRQISFVKL